MSTPSMLLLCAGAAASLSGVWTLAGLSESSPMRGTPRVVSATAIGLLVEGVVYFRVLPQARGELALPLLFATASVLSLAVGAAKIEAALLAKDGPRVIRRSAGVVSGTVFGMAAVAAASLDLAASSLGQARSGWALMFALISAACVLFAGRMRYAGAGVLSLKQRGFLLSLIAVVLLLGARLTAAATAHGPAAHVVAPPRASAASLIASAAAPLPSAPPPSDASPTPEPTAAAAQVQASAAPSAVAAAPSGNRGELQIEAVVTRGMLEADARGGVTRRWKRLQACMADPKNQQSGTLSLKVGIDPSGSVSYSKASAGDLVGTPLAACLLPAFYNMGFAAPASNSAAFEITLRAP